jgi:small-conductance mechanosensitive channel
MTDRCLHADTNGTGDESSRATNTREHVVVSTAALIGWDEYLTRSMQREYRIIQLLKEHRRRSTHARRAGSRASTSAASHSEAPQAQTPQDQASEAQSAEPGSEPAVHGGMTLEGAREAIIRERCEALRPKASWEQVAESLGVAKKTLWTHRREIFDSSHKFHPDQATQKDHETA